MGRPRRYEQRELAYLAIARVIAAILALALFKVSQEPFDTVLILILIGAGIYTGTLLALALSPYWAKYDARWFIPADLTVMGIGMAGSGGPTSEVQVIFYVWTIAMALLYSPREVVACAVAAALT